MAINRQIIGQTIIEVLITLFIITLGATALIRFQSNLAYYNSLNQQTADATTLAIERLELLRDFHALAPVSGLRAYQSLNSSSTTVVGVNTTFTVNWTVNTYLNPNYKNVNVTVSWVDRKGFTQTVQMATHIAGIDPANSAVIM
jgi:Tfp pilus assembly protein PilV